MGDFDCAALWRDILSNVVCCFLRAVCSDLAADSPLWQSPVGLWGRTHCLLEGLAYHSITVINRPNHCAKHPLGAKALGYIFRASKGA